MTFKEQKEKLFTAVQILMELYKDLAERAEPFKLTCNSELKKMTSTTFLRSLL